jgi:hypothetical protein
MSKIIEDYLTNEQIEIINKLVPNERGNINHKISILLYDYFYHLRLCDDKHAKEFRRELKIRKSKNPDIIYLFGDDGELISKENKMILK